MDGYTCIAHTCVHSTYMRPYIHTAAHAALRNLIAPIERECKQSGQPWEDPVRT